MLYQLLSITFMLFSFSFLSAQNWNKHYSENGIEISSQEDLCVKKSEGIEKNYLFLKIKNTNSEAVKLTYQIQKWYDGKCINCGQNNLENGFYTLELNPGETKTGTCEDYRDRKLAVFSSMPNQSQVRKLTQVQIIPISLNGEKL